MDAPSSFVAALRRREDAAFNALVSRHQALVTAAVARRLVDGGDVEREAGDVAAEVFVTAWRRIGEFRGETERDLVQWLLRLVDEAATS